MSSSDTESTSRTVTVVSGGKFHAPHLAQGLAQRGQLHRVVTGYPMRSQAQFGIADEKLSLVRWTLPLQRALTAVYPSGATSIAAASNLVFGYAASRRLGCPTMIHGWSGYSRECMRVAKSRGLPFVLERSSAHIATQLDLLREEAEILGLNVQQPERRWLWRDEEEYAHATLIVVPSSYARSTFRARGFDDSQLHTAPLGVDVRHFTPGPKRDRVFRAVFAGALSAQKGIHYGIEGFLRANIANSEFRLCGAFTAESNRVLSRAKADSRIVLAGHVPQNELVNHYRDSSVFVMPSVQDGFGMVLAQALATGLPLICTTNTGGPDLLQLRGAKGVERGSGIVEYPAGYVVPIRNADAIAQCMSWLAEDPLLLVSKQKEALLARSSDLSWNRYVEHVLVGYARVSSASDRTSRSPAPAVS